MFLFKRKPIKKEESIKIEKPIKKEADWSDIYLPGNKQNITHMSIQKGAPIPINQDGVAMDNMDCNYKSVFNPQTNLPLSVLNWYSSQGFIGYQACAILAQHWLIDKACTIPAQDSVRKGYEISINDGQEINPEIIDDIYNFDEEFHITKNMIEFIKMGRLFGIRIAMFKVTSGDPDYYSKPFNIDGIEPGSYKGIVQIDPYWITPELDFESSSDPDGIDYRDHAPTFYEPTWWRVNAQRIHKSHLVIMRTSEVADVLKPTYIYGGVPIPQKIYERVYAAERTANEAPLLAMTKRLNVYKMDTAKALAEEGQLVEKLEKQQALRDNYGTRVIDVEEEVQQLDTSLADFDNVLMTQYQLVAAIANIPATKLLGTQPKGFNSSGEYEEASYHEELESMQCNYLIPLINRHHALLIKSRVMPKYGVTEFTVQTVFKALDSMTAEQQAMLNKTKAETAAQLFQIGAITGEDERARIISDKHSGYNGLSETADIDMGEEFNEELQDIEQ